MALSGSRSIAHPEERTRQEVLRDSLGGDSFSRLSLVVTGEAEQGKSTLVNGLVGQQVAREGHGFKPGTTNLECFKFNQNEVQVEIWDSPGFGMADSNEDRRMIEEMKRNVGRFDLMLYCVRMDRRRWPKQMDVDTIRTITKVFGKEAWSHCLFVLTFANRAATELLNEVDKDSRAEEFSQLCWMWEDQIHQQLREQAGLVKDEFKNVRVVPVGSYKKRRIDENQWELPDRDDWFISFWIDCTTQIREAALLPLLQLNKHRLSFCTSPTDVHGTASVQRDIHTRHVPNLLDEEPKCTETFISSRNLQSEEEATDHDQLSVPTAGEDQNIYDSSFDEDSIKSGLADNQTLGSQKVPQEPKLDQSRSQRPEHRRLPTHHIMQGDRKEVSAWFKKLNALLCCGLSKTKE